jgi:recombination protein RecA
MSKSTEIAVNKLLGDLQAKFGENAVMRAADVPVRPPTTSGSLALDFATGIGGLPSDRVIEVAGDEGSGKTTLGLLTMMHFLDHSPERIAIILDTEHKLTMDWVTYLIGSERMERVIYLQPDYMEQATNMYVDAVGSGQVGFVLFDSIGGSPTKAATEKEAEKMQVGGNAGAVTKFARLASTYSSKYHCLTFCVNQVRADMDGFRRHMTPGGHGFKHACVMRIKLRRSTSDKVESVVNGEKMVVGFKVFASVIKNQVAAPGRTAWWWFYNVETPEYGFGIDTMDEIVRLSVATKVITQSGSWYSHPSLPEYKTSGEHKVQGLKGLGEAIDADPGIQATIVAETMAVLKSDATLVSEIAPFDPEAIEEDLAV